MTDWLECQEAVWHWQENQTSLCHLQEAQRLGSTLQYNL